ncbi:MAG: GNAT family N-acetyltransferase [Granulosicoccus sp.]|nr:GNAT family N-acetyltransferase [Granulosicoccus sp.]
MEAPENFRFITSRLLVDEWRSFSEQECSEQDLVAIVKSILTPDVTQSLPPQWQGEYSTERAQSWIDEQNAESVVLLVVESATVKPAGFVILYFESSVDLRLGYMLHKSYWGHGVASELIKGLVQWCRVSKISSVTGGVSRDNPGSRRVLEKNGFVLVSETANGEEELFTLRL